MAKRKRGGRKGFKPIVVKDYRSERYTFYIMAAEMGLLQAGTVDPDLTDGQVNEALIDLIEQLGEPDSLQGWLTTDPEGESEPLTVDKERKSGIIQYLIFMNLRDAFDQHGPLSAEDVIGILKVIKTSVKRWGYGDHRRGYLNYIEGFLGQMGARTWLIPPEEAEALGLSNLIAGDNDE